MTPPPTRLAVGPPLRSHRLASRRVARSKGTYACHISHVLSFNFPQSSSIASRRVHPFSARRLRPRPRVPRSPGGPPTAVSRVASRARPRRADSRLLLRRRSEARDPLKRGITDHPKQPEHGHPAPPRGASRVSHRRHRVHVRRRPLRARDDLFRDLSEHGDSHETRARVVTVEDRDRSSVPKVDFCPELELERARKGFATTSSVVERENRESARTKRGAFDDERSREEDGTRRRCDFYR